MFFQSSRICEVLDSIGFSAVIMPKETSAEEVLTMFPDAAKGGSAAKKPLEPTFAPFSLSFNRHIPKKIEEKYIYHR